MTLSDDNRKFYEQSLEITKQEVDELDQQIAAELAKVKDRLTELQKAKKLHCRCTQLPALVWAFPTTWRTPKTRPPISARSV